jgi:nicotinate-nucleotide pyrophosphorylase (carboxylating)
MYSFTFECYNVNMTLTIHQLDRTSSISSPESLDLTELFKDCLALAIREDLAGKFGCDLTTQATVGEDLQATGAIYCKQSSVVIAGLDVVETVFKAFDPNTVVTRLMQDGDVIESQPTLVATIRCRARAMLTAERIALNLIQRMCGIATLTREYVKTAGATKVKILDTRKTTPGLRVLERYAVRIGGGTNHRFGLADKILIKDNHIRIAGGVRPAIQAVRREKPDEPIEIECAALEEVRESLIEGVATIMLDNMSPNMVQQAIALIDQRAQVEVSGGINIKNLKEYLLPGVDAISIGALTHSASNVDLNLEVESVS